MSNPFDHTHTEPLLPIDQTTFICVCNYKYKSSGSKANTLKIIQPATTTTTSTNLSRVVLVCEISSARLTLIGCAK